MYPYSITERLKHSNNRTQISTMSIGLWLNWVMSFNQCVMSFDFTYYLILTYVFVLFFKDHLKKTSTKNNSLDVLTYWIVKCALQFYHFPTVVLKSATNTMVSTRSSPWGLVLHDLPSISSFSLVPCFDIHPFLLGLLYAFTFYRWHGNWEVGDDSSGGWFSWLCLRLGIRNKS